ncbi:glutamate synthase-related protein [Paradesertivirga mongoliensis]|uniref:Glutamate synthase-related protein n=1 Tax=Paradesertivirga mongoliensis TaxID=2100740 RepID=A0ABW4ZMJ3_9SPHI|nr:glutamate synthase-related protein [Pedobacter mongoliensis]
MKKIRFRSLVESGFIVLFSVNIGVVLAGLISNVLWFTLIALMLSVMQLVLHDLFNRKNSILRYYPFAAKLKHVFGKITPKSLFADHLPEHLVDARQHQLIMNRAKNIPTELVRNTLSHSSGPDFECLRHLYNTQPIEHKVTDLRTVIGTAQCSQPYNLSILNVGALNQSVLKNSSILALSEGANIRGCAVNTGRAGISTYLIRGGGDLIWQIAHEDYAFRNSDGSFNEKLYQVTASRPYIKMVEVILPRHEVSIMKRLVGDRMIHFLDRLRTLSNGKPIGIRVFSPSKEVVISLCKSMFSAKIHLDFITVDSTVSVSGFDSASVSNATTSAYLESLSFLRKTLDNYGLPTKIIASGNIISEYDILRSVALGANACYCTTPMVLALDSNSKFRFKDPAAQRVRVANFHRNTLEATIKLMELCAYQSLDEVKASDFYRKINVFEIKSLKEIYFDEQPIKGPQLFSGLS